MLEFKTVMKIFYNCVKNFFRWAEILIILIFFLIIFSWVGYVVWFDVPNQENYNSFLQSLSSTQIMMTTVNFPSIMVKF